MSATHQSLQAQIPVRINLALAACFIFLNIYQLCVLPTLLIPANPWWGLTLLPIALLTTLFWSVIHESIHGVLSPNKTINNTTGRILCILFGASFSMLRFGHLMHHRIYSAPVEKVKDYHPKIRIPLLKKIFYYFGIFFGVYAMEIGSNLLVLLPVVILKKIFAFSHRHYSSYKDVLMLVEKQLLDNSTLREARLDSVIVLTIYISSFILYGAYGWLLLAALVLRGFFISFMDNIYHFDSDHRSNRSIHNLWLPHWLSRFILYSNYHHIHHLYPKQPWPALPEIFKHEQISTIKSSFWQAAIQQLRGPVNAT